MTCADRRRPAGETIRAGLRPRGHVATAALLLAAVALPPAAGAGAREEDRTDAPDGEYRLAVLTIDQGSRSAGWPPADIPSTLFLDFRDEISIAIDARVADGQVTRRYTGTARNSVTGWTERANAGELAGTVKSADQLRTVHAIAAPGGCGCPLGAGL
jgi:hypothetical protein